MRRICPTILGAMLVVFALAGVTATAQWRTDDASVPRTTLKELQSLMAQGNVLIIDVRAVSEYQVGHIPGSVSIPLGTEATRIPELRRVEKSIVTYCT